MSIANPVQRSFANVHAARAMREALQTIACQPLGNVSHTVIQEQSESETLGRITVGGIEYAITITAEASE